MQRDKCFALLIIVLLLLLVFPLKADSDRIQITSASVICGRTGIFLGAAYTITANYTADDHRIIDDYMTIGSGGGRIDTFHHVEAGTDSISVASGSYGGSMNGPPDYPFTIDLGIDLYAATTVDNVNGRIVFNGPLVGRSTASAVCTQDGPTEVIIAEGDGGQGFDPGDGRIEPDAAAPIAVYCHDYGIDVYGINQDSTGSLVFTATTEEIDAVGTAPDENTLIEAHGNIRLYRLTTGEFQINAGPDAEGKEYILIWQDC